MSWMGLFRTMGPLKLTAQTVPEPSAGTWSTMKAGWERTNSRSTGVL